MKINAANISPIIRLPSANDERHQPNDRGHTSTDSDFVDRRQNRQKSSEYVFRGEVLQSVENDKHYNPNYNQHIDPQNREAISNYQSTSVVRIETQSLGLIVDQFI